MFSCSWNFHLISHHHQPFLFSRPKPTHLENFNVKERPLAFRHPELMCSEHKLPHQLSANSENHYSRVHRRVSQQILQHVVLLVCVVATVAQQIISVELLEELQHTFLLESILEILTHGEREEIGTVDEECDILEAELVEDAEEDGLEATLTVWHSRESLITWFVFEELSQRKKQREMQISVMNFSISSSSSRLTELSFFHFDVIRPRNPEVTVNWPSLGGLNKQKIELEIQFLLRIFFGFSERQLRDLGWVEREPKDMEIFRITPTLDTRRALVLVRTKDELYPFISILVMKNVCLVTCPRINLLVNFKLNYRSRNEGKSTLVASHLTFTWSPIPYVCSEIIFWM